MSHIFLSETNHRPLSWVLSGRAVIWPAILSPHLVCQYLHVPHGPQWGRTKATTQKFRSWYPWLPNTAKRMSKFSIQKMTTVGSAWDADEAYTCTDWYTAVIVSLNSGLWEKIHKTLKFRKIYTKHSKIVGGHSICEQDLMFPRESVVTFVGLEEKFAVHGYFCASVWKIQVNISSNFTVIRPWQEENVWMYCNRVFGCTERSSLSRSEIFCIEELQHTALNDSFIVFFRSGNLPLTARKAKHDAWSDGSEK